MLSTKKFLTNTILALLLSLFTVIAITVYRPITSINPKHNLYIYYRYSNGLKKIYAKFAGFFLNKKYPEIYINLDKLNYKIKNPANWVTAQINKDFANYNNLHLSTKNVIDTYYNLPDNDLVVLFEIKNGKLKVNKKPVDFNDCCLHGIKIYSHIFEYLAKNNYVNNVSFLLRMSDFMHQATSEQLATAAPILTTSKDLAQNKEKNFILIPDYMCLEDIPKIAPRVIYANKLFPWHNKEHSILWRGSFADISGFRHRLVDFSKNNKNSIIDAKFAQDNPKNYMKPELQVKAKFLLTIDGHTAAWTRPAWQLLANSVMLKQDSSLTQWYYDALKPDVHYIAVPSDPNQLKNIVNSYTEQQLIDIANQSTEFATNNLLIEDMVAYIAQVLNTYATYQQNIDLTYGTN